MTRPLLLAVTGAPTILIGPVTVELLAITESLAVRVRSTFNRTSTDPGFAAQIAKGLTKEATSEFAMILYIDSSLGPNAAVQASILPSIP